MLEEPGFLKIKDQCRSKDTMVRKLAHVLIFLLIILKEPNMPEAADCSCKPSPVCKCPGMGLTSIPQNLPTSIVDLDLKYNLITTVDQSLLLRVVSSTVCSIALIGGTIFVVWCKRRIGHPPLGLNPNVVGGITNTAISVMADVHDNQQEDIDRNCDQTEQGRSQASTESKTNTTAAVLASGDDQTGQAQSPTIANLSRNKVPALKPDFVCTLYVSSMYADAETTPKSAGIVSSHDQTRQDQSHAITESNTNTTCAAVASGDDQTGRDQSHAIIDSNTNTTCAAVASGDDHHYEDVDNHRVQSQAITESNTNTTCAAVASGDDQTGRDQSHAITESNTNTTCAAVASGDDQTGRDQSHAITESNTNTTFATVASGEDHHYEDVDNHRVQSQATTESLAARNLSYGTGSTSSQLNSLYKTVEQLE
ncbi:hypothetical protein Bbelb_142800 [Branchiostoma belcheri]|nr:hypothetical protein Bbelb_142800 [Branchiostoma belcheri]